MADFDPKISSGAVAAGSQLAKDNGATTQNPTSTIIYDARTLRNVPGAEIQQQYVSNLARARLAEAGVSIDKGLDAKTIPLSTSQATPPYDINALANSSELDAITAFNNQAAAFQAGVGARGDDGITVTGNSTKDIIKATFQTNTNQRIYTQPNVLDDYASYTYQISWYLLDPVQYNQLTSSIKPNTSGWSLLMQSGGAALPVNSNTSTSAPGRNPQFPLDFYLDDLEIHSKTPGKGVGMPHNAVELKFKVIEPNGLTLIDRLYAAVKGFYGPGENSPELDATGSLAQQANGGKPVKEITPNYINAPYCLGIRFYGYDSAGNLVAPATGKYSGPKNNSTAIIEKLIAFNITDLKFRMAAGQNSKGIEYNITGKPIPMNHAFGQARGSIPFPFELSGTTVKDLLIGKPAQSELKLSTIQDGRVPQSGPPAKKVPPAPVVPPTLSSIVTGQDNPLATTGGMDFTAGNF
jgi:hypothetical protein